MALLLRLSFLIQLLLLPTKTFPKSDYPYLVFHSIAANDGGFVC
ncbi:hypothetical protein B4102_0686 [Heyndrickxia sporothermodurans]|uniref:Uncharacterized protein n=1 Tax=Heyndrickxia sporothermodurans TaxID=46224 RepID=A0A150L9D7_9BACI|nr:hypothetical protein B4102_0686 [Heyndrickxia sporothermodurans]